MATRFTTLETAGAMTVGGLLTTVTLVLTGLLTFTSATGDTLDLTGTGSGRTIIVESLTGTASGYVTIRGSNSGVSGSGGVLCIEDNDGAGFSLFSCLNGTCTARSAAANECPTG